jgi:hypothetical protein
MTSIFTFSFSLATRYIKEVEELKNQTTKHKREKSKQKKNIKFQLAEFQDSRICGLFTILRSFAPFFLFFISWSVWFFLVLVSF